MVWRNAAGVSATARTDRVLNDHRADWREAWALFPGDVAYIWHAAVHARTVIESLEAADLTIRSQIIWAKSHRTSWPRSPPRKPGSGPSATPGPTPRHRTAAGNDTDEPLVQHRPPLTSPRRIAGR